jgi:transposase InsO family protein
MKVNRRVRLFTIILTVVGLAALALPVYGQTPTDLLESVLTITPLEAQPIGVPFTITAQLSGVDGRPNPNKVLILYLNDEQIRRIRTDDQGLAAIRVGEDLSPGEYTIRVDFTGTQAYLPASATITLTVRPAVLTITTIPPLADIPFDLGGKRFTSDENGVARLDVTEAGDYDLEVLLSPDTEVSPDTRVTFDRWKDEFQPQRTVTIRGDVSMEAGFSISHPVSQTFIDLDDNPVEMTRIDTLTLQGTDGSKFTFDDGQERWLRSGRIARRREGLELTPIQYSVESVIISGSNVVNRYQQRFFVEPGDVWSIRLLLYYATIRAEDALFGSPIGTGIRLEYPDGHTEHLDFGEDGEITIGPVPRGVYRVQVVGASGMAPVTPVALSRDQSLDLKVLSSLNITLGVGVGIFGALGLLLYGRPYLPRLAFQTTMHIATLGFLKNGVRKQARITTNVQYLLPETNVVSSGHSALPVSQENASAIEAKRAVVEMSITNPLYGRRRVSKELEKRGILISPSHVRSIQLQHRLETVESRLSALVTQLTENPETAVIAALVRAKNQKPIKPQYPGHIGAQDTYYIGYIKGVGQVYQQTFIDVYSGVALVRLYERKDSQVAVDMLKNYVRPWFERRDLRVASIMTDRGREYVGSGWAKTNHPYETYLAVRGVDHIKTESRDPQINTICMRFHRKIRNEFYGKVLRKKHYASLEVLQQAVDGWVNWHNSERPCDSQGRTPFDRLHTESLSAEFDGEQKTKAEYAGRSARLRVEK